ncbi:MAG: hypothetical protein OXR66_08730 [Candidatus Woesearchaeota archaeon]|nr:hypothetical protein [Candidatus Woesearchaeota archaeon]
MSDILYEAFGAVRDGPTALRSFYSKRRSPDDSKGAHGRFVTSFIDLENDPNLRTYGWLHQGNLEEIREAAGDAGDWAKPDFFCPWYDAVFARFEGLEKGQRLAEDVLGTFGDFAATVRLQHKFDRTSTPHDGYDVQRGNFLQRLRGAAQEYESGTQFDHLDVHSIGVSVRGVKLESGYHFGRWAARTEDRLAEVARVPR